jgi:uncharacterized protein YbjT (DUF2867 family)
MSIVLVTGGSGVLGSKIVPLLRESGHEVRVLFHELLAGGLSVAGRLPLAPLPLDWQFQSVAAAEVAARAAEILDGETQGRATDFGGPEVLTARAILDVWRERHGRPRRVVKLRVPGRFSSGLREGRNTCPEHADGRQRWVEFVNGG